MINIHVDRKSAKDRVGLVINGPIKWLIHGLVDPIRTYELSNEQRAPGCLRYSGDEILPTLGPQNHEK